MFGYGYEVEYLVKILKLGLVKILKVKFSRDADVWLKFLVDA